MEQFSLEKYLENPTRKVVTRDGRPVRILCTDAKAKDGCCIIAAIETDGEEEGYQFYEDGRAYSSKSCIEDCADLFFADEGDKSQSIEIPFGAKDSEFIRDEYLIPEGCEARIEGNKVIIEKIQNEELTEFEKAVKQVMWTAYNYDDCSTGKDVDDISNVKATSKTLLDLARKEILKDLPKWKKATEHLRGEGFIHYDNHSHRMTAEYAYTNVEGGEYYLSIDDLETLPKE